MSRPMTVTSEKLDGPEGVAQQHPPRRDPLGLGHRDVVLLQRRDEVGAQQAHVHGHLAEGQGQRGQEEVVQVARSGRVKNATSLVTGNQPRFTAKIRISRMPTTKSGTDNMPKATVVDDRSKTLPGPLGGDQGHGHGHEQCQDLRVDQQLDGHGQPLLERLGHRRVVDGRGAHVARGHVARATARSEPAMRLVEAELLARLLEAGLVAADAAHHLGGVARQQVQHEEGQEGHRQQHEDQLHDVAYARTSCRPSVRPSASGRPHLRSIGSHRRSRRRRRWAATPRRRGAGRW